MKQDNSEHDVHIRRQLSHVLWLGGGTDAGKSSVVKALGEKYQFRWYNFDHFEPDHLRRMDREAHPASFAFLDMTPDLRWVLRSAEDMTRSTIAMWQERFSLVIADLLGWPRDGVIVAEGPGLFPECVAPYIRSPNQALWLVPTGDFKRAIFPTRENKMAVAAATSDALQARSNILERDLLIGEHIREQAHAHGLTMFEVDGSKPMLAVAEEVERHFKPHLATAPRR